MSGTRGVAVDTATAGVAVDYLDARDRCSLQRVRSLCCKMRNGGEAGEGDGDGEEAPTWGNCVEPVATFFQRRRLGAGTVLAKKAP